MSNERLSPLDQWKKVLEHPRVKAAPGARQYAQDQVDLLSRPKATEKAPSPSPTKPAEPKLPLEYSDYPPWVKLANEPAVPARARRYYQELIDGNRRSASRTSTAERAPSPTKPEPKP